MPAMLDTSVHDHATTPLPDRQRPRTRLLALTLAVAVVALVAALFATSGYTIARPPEESSAEAGFARDMSAHHSQAVEMAELLRGATSDPEMQLLASDIALTQQAQIGQMQGWLELWGLRAASSARPMAWMGMGIDTMADMPGMASRDQIAQLALQDGTVAETTFLQLMIDHHIAGVEMAEAVLDRTDQPAVTTLAERIAASQQSEIQTMQTLLESRGGDVSTSPENAMEGMDMGDEEMDMGGDDDAS